MFQFQTTVENPFSPMFNFHALMQYRIAFHEIYALVI